MYDKLFEELKELVRRHADAGVPSDVIAVYLDYRLAAVEAGAAREPLDDGEELDEEEGGPDDYDDDSAGLEAELRELVQEHFDEGVDETEIKWTLTKTSDYVDLLVSERLRSGARDEVMAALAASDSPALPADAASLADELIGRYPDRWAQVVEGGTHLGWFVRRAMVLSGGAMEEDVRAELDERLRAAQAAVADRGGAL